MHGAAFHAALLVLACGLWRGANALEAHSQSDSTRSRDAARTLQQTATLGLGAPLPLPKTPDEHCKGVRGSWCHTYYRQTPVPTVPPKRGQKSCPSGCNTVGVCNHDTGQCHCPAGWEGPGCTHRRTRPCFNMGPDKRDLGWHAKPDWLHSRCAGICDDEIGMCYCPPETKFGHIASLPGSMPGAAPLKRGRPMFWCQPSTDANGTKVHWGAVKYEDLLGPQGWCNAEVPKFHCPCRIDGYIGSFCNIAVEQLCANQCSGHGECQRGFCKCHPGWYGNDCSRKRAGLPYDPGDEVLAKPWLRAVITPPVAAEDPPTRPTRRRPFIYVYDLGAHFSSDILQYRIERHACQYRLFEHGNQSTYVGYYAYAVEPVLHEAFLASPHRTYDPEEADFFYAPLPFACFFDVYTWSHAPRWPPGSASGPRPYGAAMFQREAARWLNTTFPYMRRRGGRDHIWLTPHDEGACYVWKDLWPGIFLTHWGRMDFPHASQTQYHSDLYHVPMHHDAHPGDWTEHTSKAHPCYDPTKDLVIPAFKQASSYAHSPFMGAAPQQRSTLLFFRGDMARHRNDVTCTYSRCIRQTLYNLSRAHDWASQGVVLGDQQDVPGDYSSLLASSVFCLVLPGDGWSPRMEDAVLHGCIPVIIMDQVHVPLEALLDVGSFSIRVPQSDLAKVLDIVKAVPLERIQAMQEALSTVWHRYRYNGLMMLQRTSRETLKHNAQSSGGVLRPSTGTQYADSAVDDAFETIMQWLHSRIKHARADPNAPRTDEDDLKKERDALNADLLWGPDGGKYQRKTEPSVAAAGGEDVKYPARGSAITGSAVAGRAEEEAAAAADIDTRAGAGIDAQSKAVAGGIEAAAGGGAGASASGGGGGHAALGERVAEALGAVKKLELELEAMRQQLQQLQGQAQQG